MAEFIPQILFYTFATVLVLSGLAVITVRNPVHAALFLILAFVSCACIWMLLEVEFLAITLVLVYVGAVMVLFLFVVMMLDINLDLLKQRFASYLPVSLLVAVVMLIEMMMVVGAKHFSAEQFPQPEPHPLGYSNTEELGELLYTKYLYAFEIASVILVVAIIAAIALTLRKRPDTRHQDPSRQVQIKKEDRLRVIQMDTDSDYGSES